jgi:hypothetical protein
MQTCETPRLRTIRPFLRPFGHRRYEHPHRHLHAGFRLSLSLCPVLVTDKLQVDEQWRAVRSSANRNLF